MEGFCLGFFFSFEGGSVCLGFFFPWLIPCSYWGLVGREYHTQRHGLLLTPRVAATIPADREGKMKLPGTPVITAAKPAGNHPSEQGKSHPWQGGSPAPAPARPCREDLEAFPGV